MLRGLGVLYCGFCMRPIKSFLFFIEKPYLQKEFIYRQEALNFLRELYPDVFNQDSYGTWSFLVKASDGTSRLVGELILATSGGWILRYADFIFKAGIYD